MTLIEQLHFTLQSETEQAIAKTVLSDPQSVYTMTLRELSRKAGASPSSILRFVQKPGFDGYRSFLLALAKGAGGCVRVPVDWMMPFAPGSSEETILNAMEALSIQTVHAARSHLDPRQVHRSALALLHADHIFTLAAGDSRIRLDQLTIW